MGRNTQPRVIRSGPFIPTVPRSGSEGDNIIWRKNNAIMRGRAGRFYEQVYQGSLNLHKQADTAALTGTVALTAGNRWEESLVVGTGTLFRTECHLGQKILAINALGTRSWLIVPKIIHSDTEMTIWASPDTTVSGITAYRMSRVFPVNSQIGTMLWGDVIPLDKGGFFSVGNGVFYLDGQVLPGTSLVATPEPQYTQWDPVTETYTNFTLGMDESAPPGLSAVGGGTKGMQGGDYSMLISPARMATKGYNNPSERADVTISTGDMIEVTFPAMDTANGQDAWLVWVTTFQESLGGDKNNFNGPWYKFPRFIDTTEVSSAGGVVNLEWLDAEVELNGLATFNNDPPPAAEGVQQLTGIPIFISCEGPGYTRSAVTTPSAPPGPVIFPVKINNIEAAPTEIAFPTSPPEIIVGAISGPTRLYLCQPNHLSIAQTTGNDTVPVIIRPFWHDGFAGPDQIILNNAVLYAFTVGGPARSSSDGDEQEAEKDWAGDVGEVMSTWIPGHVMVGYHPAKEQVVFFHAADRLNDYGFWTTRWFSYGLPQQTWIGAGEYTSRTEDRIVSGVATVAERLVFVRGGRMLIAA